jgi:hypothetical protein
MSDVKSGKSEISGQNVISLDDVYRKIEEVANLLQQKGGFLPPESEHWKPPAFPGLPPTKKNIKNETEDIYDKILRLQDEIERLKALIEQGPQLPATTPSYVPPIR